MSRHPVELRRAEERVARTRIELTDELDEWVRDKRDAMVSLGGLVGALAAGFVLGGLIRRRQPHSVSAAAQAGRTGLLSVLAGLGMSALRMYYPNPWSALPEVLMRRRQGQASAAPLPGSGAVAPPLRTDARYAPPVRVARNRP